MIMIRRSLDGDSHEHDYIPPERRLGVDFWRAHECSHNYYDSPYYDDSGEMKKWEGYDAFAQTDCTIDYLESRQHEDDPFFLFVSYGPPHTPTWCWKSTKHFKRKTVLYREKMCRLSVKRLLGGICRVIMHIITAL